MFLYKTTLGPSANICVTHNFACPEWYEVNTTQNTVNDGYRGNLALHVNDDLDAVKRRREYLKKQLNVPIQWVKQVHGVQVYQVNQIPTEDPVADVLLTQEKHIALGILTADCLPIVFATNDGMMIANVHAGWRGLLSGVLHQTWEHIRAVSPNSTVLAHIGPCIGVGQFEVGAEVREAFIHKNRQFERYFTVNLNSVHKTTYLCDLEGLARAELLNLGVNNVTGGGWCTVSDPRLASYRRLTARGRPSGRFATLVYLN